MSIIIPIFFILIALVLLLVAIDLLVITWMDVQEQRHKRKLEIIKAENRHAEL